MNITIIEDDKQMAYNIAKKVKDNGFSYQVFNSYKDFRNNNYYNSDLFIIDLNLGDGNGMDIVRYIKIEKKSLSPIIICSGENDIETKIHGLNIGADDYLLKPFSPSELIARVRALIRRSYKIIYHKNYIYKKFTYNSEFKILTKNDKKISLSLTEILLIELFLINIGKIISKERIINSVWGEYDYTLVSDNTINVTISRLRKKLGASFKLKTVSSRGYILEK